MKYKLSQIIDLIGGGTPKTSVSEYWDGDIPWLSVKDFGNQYRYVYETEKHISKLGLENSSTKLLQKGDVIISARGTVGEVATIPYPMAFNQSCYGIRAKENIVDKDFLYYLIKHSVKVLKLKTHGTVFDTITRDTFDSIEVDIPNLNSQRKIAKILSDLDAKIEINSTINNNLHSQALAIFDNYFKDISQIPLGWKKASLVDIADYLNGLAMQKFRPKNDEIGLPVLKIKELRQGYCDDDSELCSPNIKKDYIINNGDVIFSWSGTLLVDFWTGGVSGLNQHLFKVTSKKYAPWFYYLWTRYHLSKFIAIAADKATTMGHIKREDLIKAEVLIPNESDYKSLGSLLEPIFSLIIANRLENNKLILLRETLLPRLMSNEVNIDQVSL